MLCLSCDIRNQTEDYGLCTACWSDLFTRDKFKERMEKLRGKKVDARASIEPEADTVELDLKPPDPVLSPPDGPHESGGGYSHVAGTYDQVSNDVSLSQDPAGCLKHFSAATNSFQVKKAGPYAITAIEPATRLCFLSWARLRPDKTYTLKDFFTMPSGPLALQRVVLMQDETVLPVSVATSVGQEPAVSIPNALLPAVILSKPGQKPRTADIPTEPHPDGGIVISALKGLGLSPLDVMDVAAVLECNLQGHEADMRMRLIRVLQLEKKLMSVLNRLHDKRATMFELLITRGEGEAEAPPPESKVSGELAHALDNRFASLLGGHNTIHELYEKYSRMRALRLAGHNTHLSAYSAMEEFLIKTMSLGELLDTPAAAALRGLTPGQAMRILTAHLLTCNAACHRLSMEFEQQDKLAEAAFVVLPYGTAMRQAIDSQLKTTSFSSNIAADFAREIEERCARNRSQK